MVRFFTAQHDISAHSIVLSAEDSDHIRSLRLRPDELFTVCDGEGNDYICRLGKLDADTTAEIVRREKSSGEPSIECRVFLAYSKGDRLDYAVQKSVELGAFEIVLFESGRCISVPRDIPKKTARLQRIALETAKQCGRGIIPVVSSGGKLDNVVAAAKHSALPIFCYEAEDNLSLKEVLERFFPASRKPNEDEIKSVSIFTGPEGGFEQAEVELARANSFHIVSLGSRILRSESAPVVALSAFMYHTGNLE